MYLWVLHMKFWSFSSCKLFRIGFWFDFFLEFWSLIGYAWLVLLWFILELGYAYKILELFWLQVIQDWSLVWFFFRILELDWLCMIGFAVIFYRIGLCIWNFGAFLVAGYSGLVFGLNFFLEFWSLTGYAWLVLLWFFLEFG